MTDMESTISEKMVKKMNDLLLKARNATAREDWAVCDKAVKELEKITRGQKIAFNGYSTSWTFGSSFVVKCGGVVQNVYKS